MASEWNRLTRHAKRCIMASQELAITLFSPSVEIEHLVLTLIDDPESSASVLIRIAGVNVESLRTALETRVGEMPVGDQTEQPPFSNKLRVLISLAAQKAGPQPVGTEFLLLAAIGNGNALGDDIQAIAEIPDTAMDNALVLLQSHELHQNEGSPPRSQLVQQTSIPKAQPFVAEPSVVSMPPEHHPSRPSNAPPDLPVKEDGSHALQALSRLIVDLSGKASRSAREQGNTVLADQIDRMRTEVERLMKSARPASNLGAPPPWQPDRGD